jgi:hypothetical protein
MQQTAIFYLHVILDTCGMLVIDSLAALLLRSSVAEMAVFIQTASGRMCEYAAVRSWMDAWMHRW